MTPAHHLRFPFPPARETQMNDNFCVFEDEAGSSKVTYLEFDCFLHVCASTGACLLKPRDTTRSHLSRANHCTSAPSSRIFLCFFEHQPKPNRTKSSASAEQLTSQAVSRKATSAADAVAQTATATATATAKVTHGLGGGHLRRCRCRCRCRLCHSCLLYTSPSPRD